MNNEQNFSIEDFSIGLVSGLIAGAVMGIIFAPSSGQRTRNKIQDWALDTKQSASEIIDKTKEPVEKIIQKTQSVLGLEEKGLRKKLEQIKAELEKFDLNSN